MTAGSSMGAISSIRAAQRGQRRTSRSKVRRISAAHVNAAIFSASGSSGPAPWLQAAAPQELSHVPPDGVGTRAHPRDAGSVTSARNSNSLVGCRWLRAPATMKTRVSGCESLEPLSFTQTSPGDEGKARQAHSSVSGREGMIFDAPDAPRTPFSPGPRPRSPPATSYRLTVSARPQSRGHGSPTSVRQHSRALRLFPGFTLLAMAELKVFLCPPAPRPPYAPLAARPASNTAATVRDRTWLSSMQTI